MALNKIRKVNIDNTKYKLIPFHKLPQNFREECHQLLQLEFNGYFEYKLVSN